MRERGRREGKGGRGRERGKGKDQNGRGAVGRRGGRTEREEEIHTGRTTR